MQKIDAQYIPLGNPATGNPEPGVTPDRVLRTATDRNPGPVCNGPVR